MITIILPFLFLCLTLTVRGQSIMPLTINATPDTNTAPTYHIKLGWIGQSNETYSLSENVSNIFNTPSNTYTVSNLIQGNVYIFSIAYWSNGLESMFNTDTLTWPPIYTNWLVITHQYSSSMIGGWEMWTNGDIFQPGSEGMIFFRDSIIESNNITPFEHTD